jgi:integral membrane protein (TIGR01906 family)
MKEHISTAILGFSVCIAIIILAVNITLIFKPLYYYDVKSLNIVKDSQISEDVIKSNYDYTIDYLSPLNTEKEYKLPSLPSSINGAIHFQQVKVIFVNITYALYFCLIISLLLVLKYNYINIQRFLKYSTSLLFVLPVMLAVPFIVNFDSSFTTFHKLFFNNDYWLFDPDKDPIIKILPEQYFFHCAILIVFLLVLAACLLLFMFKRKGSISKN